VLVTAVLVGLIAAAAASGSGRFFGLDYTFTELHNRDAQTLAKSGATRSPPGARFAASPVSPLMRHLDDADSGDMLRPGWDPPFGRSLIEGGETTDEVVSLRVG